MNEQDEYRQSYENENGVKENIAEENIDPEKAEETAEIISGNEQPTAQKVQSEISYSPVEEEPKKREYSTVSYLPKDKEKKPREEKKFGLTAVIAICLAAVILSGVVSFGAAYLAGKLTQQSGEKTVETIKQQNEPLVIYKDTVTGTKTDSEKPTSSVTGEALSYKEVAELVKDSVVEINTEYTTQSMWFQYVNGGAGSGVILSEDGYVVTNAHVIMNEDETATADSVTVRLANGEEYKAEIKGYDTESDIAVLKIDATGLEPVQCGNSDNLAVGEEVIVVGNPLGELGGTVTNGIVSATEREISVNGTKMTLIQTNAAVNPGNSGGGMFNMEGKLVGIVNAKSSGTNVEGLGFAIPVNDAVTVTEQLMEYGYVRGKVEIGIKFRQVTQNSSFYSYYNIKPGIYVDLFTKDYNEGALKVGDRIIAVNGYEIATVNDISEIVRSSSVGDKLTFQFYRDGKLLEAEVTCYEKLPEEDGEKEEKEIQFDENDESTQLPPENFDEYYYSDPFGMDDFFKYFFGR